MTDAAVMAPVERPTDAVGNDGAGPDAPVVLIPGSLCDERLFKPLQKILESRTGAPTTIVVDLGMSRSIEAMADTVLDQAPGTFHLLGLSLGGIVAAEIVHRNADRVTGLALLDTNLAPPDTSQLDTRRRWASTTRSGAYHQVVAEIVRSMGNRSPAADRAAATMALDAGPTVFLAQNEALLNRRDRRADLADFAGSTIVATGSEDPLCPPSIHRSLADRTPNARYTEIAGAGHLSTIDQPSQLADMMLGWLSTSNTNHNQGRRNP